MGKQGDLRENHGKTMEKQWENMGLRCLRRILAI